MLHPPTLKRVTRCVITAGLCLILTCRAFGQVHDRYEDWCDSLRNAASPDLAQFLNAIVPDEKNAKCITWAIHKVGNDHYEPAIAALVKLLDFRRPPTSLEKMGYYHHPQGVWETYPSVAALPLFGSKALPELLRAIEADSTSASSRDNAISVWMEIHRENDDQPKGISLLKHEESNAKDEKTRQRLKWAVQKALMYCNPTEEPDCRQEAK